MATRDKGLSDEAQQWDDLIREVHQAEQGGGDGPDSTPSEPYKPSYDVGDEYAVKAHGFRIDQAVKRLFATAGGKIVLAAIALLFILLALAYIPNWGSDEENTPSGSPDEAVAELDQLDASRGDAAQGDPAEGDTTSADATGGEPVPGAANPAVIEDEVLPPTHAELAAQAPIPLTEGTWRFFADATEGHALYDFAFEPTGRFYEDDAEHNEGAYEVAATSVEMTLVRVDTVTASREGNERSQEIAWNEWFTMTRTGNTMTGTWDREAWIFSYEDGLVFRGMTDPATEIFARPHRPDDVG